MSSKPSLNDLLKKATELAETGRQEEAEASFTRIIAQYPRDSRGLLGRSLLRLARGNADGALEDVNEALRLGEDWFLYTHRATIRRSIGQRGEALGDIERALSLRPLKSHAKRALEYLRTQLQLK